MRKILPASAFAIALAAWPAAAQAQISVPGALDVQITIQAACDISGNTGGTLANALLDFGTHGLLQTAIDAETTTDANALQVLCTPGVSYSLEFGPGLHSEGPGPQNRRMASSGNFIPYQLFYQNQALGSIGPRLATGSLETIIIQGRVPAQPGVAPPPGTYTDTVVITLSF